MSRRPQPTLLKLIRGDLHESRHKDDKPKIEGLPLIPPGITLDDDERLMWDWLMHNVVVPGIHGTADGAMFVGVVKLWASWCDADRKVRKQGPVMKNPETGKPELQPHARLARDLWRELRISLGEIGGSPPGRATIAGPRGDRTLGDAASWDEID